MSSCWGALDIFQCTTALQRSLIPSERVIQQSPDSPDIQDTEGDRENRIHTFSTELGREKAFILGIKVLLVEYGIAIVVGASSASTLFSKFVSVAGHCLLALALWFRSRSVDVKNNSSAISFYMFIWKLFYAGNVLMLFYR
ncbi:coumarin 8-geranyltransferase 1b, chloroplastic-like [Telopea speciosissima]|uniref:coumarin 8-geranyltransferase 1b, chloroplastic-like n=1 Tax=Telopea speciosissima TaxID=54955 RepID=UPI001CC44C6D|nr:coumarin 8-geranyltransferase 1b, chloroplastic-like [Telopea speciosissima]